MAVQGRRNVVSQFHLWLGLAAPVLLFLHIRNGRKAVGDLSRKRWSVSNPRLV